MMKKSWIIMIVMSLALPVAFIAGCSSSPANPTTSTAAGLTFTTQPAGAVAGVAFTTQPIVDVVDASGNIDSGYNGVVVLAITTGTGTSGATLTGTANVDAVNGIATFSNLSIDTAGSAYSLTATNDSGLNAVSSSFDVAAAPATTTGA